MKKRDRTTGFVVHIENPHKMYGSIYIRINSKSCDPTRSFDNFSVEKSLLVSWVSVAKWRNTRLTFRGKLARKTRTDRSDRRTSDYLRWNGSHAQASLEFRPSLVTCRHRKGWNTAAAGELPRESRARFSLPARIWATSGVQKCPICPFPTNRPDHISLVSSLVEFRA